MESLMPPRKTTTTSRKNYNWNYCNPSRTTKRTPTNTATWPCNSPKFRIVRNECQWRMGSYWNVYSQFATQGRWAYMSPTTANRWIRYVNNGRQVYMFSNRDFCSYWGNKFANANPRTAYQYLRNHYGNIIKDVTRGKGSCWLIATTRTPTARPFTNYNWY
jgi:hypothetical protein